MTPGAALEFSFHPPRGDVVDPQRLLDGKNKKNLKKKKNKKRIAKENCGKYCDRLLFNCSFQTSELV